MSFVDLKKWKRAFPSLNLTTDVKTPAYIAIRDPEFVQSDAVVEAALTDEPESVEFVRINIRDKKEGAIYKAIKEYPRIILSIKNPKLSYLQCALRHQPTLLGEFGYRRLNTTMLVDLASSYMKYMPARMQKQIIHSYVTKHNHMSALKFVKSGVMSSELWAEAVLKDFSILAQVPQKFRTKAFYIVLLRQYPAFWSRIEDTPANRKSAVRVNPSVVTEFAASPEELRELAVINPSIAQFVKLPVITIKSLMVGRHIIVPLLRTVDSRYTDEERNELHEYAFDKNHIYIESMINPSDSICQRAVTADWNLLPFTKSPERYYRKAFDQNKDAFFMVDWESLSEPEQVYTLEKCPELIRFVPNVADAMKLKCVTNDGLLLKYIQNQTEQICDAAVRQNSAALQYARCQTFAMCEFAIREDPRLLRYVREQTIKLCNLAVSLNVEAIKFVHPSIVDEIIMMQQLDGQ